MPARSTPRPTACSRSTTRTTRASRRRALFTQFEASDARRFVPSWDEPDYNATFDLTARVPGRPDGGQQHAGRLERDARQRPQGRELRRPRRRCRPTCCSSARRFRAHHQEGRPTAKSASSCRAAMGDKARYALDAEAQILPYYNDYFGTPYPLPKLDNVAGPGQSQFFGAMENWGAIFTFEDPLLTIRRSPPRATSSASTASKRTRWRTSGSATWSPWRGGTTCGSTRVSPPGWRTRPPSISIPTGARMSSRSPIARRRNGPRLVPTPRIRWFSTIRTVEQANQAFDSITYDKGESVISMLEGFAGENVWRDGPAQLHRQIRLPQLADRRPVGRHGERPAPRA